MPGMSKDARIAKLNTQIAEYEKKIADCKAKIEELQKPPIRMKDITDKIKEKGISLDDLMDIQQN